MRVFLPILGRLRLSRGVLAGAALLSVGAAFCIGPIAAQETSNPLQQLMGAQGLGNGSSGNGLGGDSDGMGKQRTVTIEPAVPNARPQPRSALEQILSVRAGVPLKQFGYDDLGTGRPVLLPQSGGMQENYVLGPGDEIIVSLRGQESSQNRTIVDPSGRVVLPRLPPITVAGRTFGEFRRDLAAAVQRAYVATEAFASLGSIKQVRVTVGGEVNNPGLRVMTGLASALDAILVSGGIKKTGSLRSIHILREGVRINVDLYSVLRGTAGPQVPLLADGDRVIVSPLGPTVAVAGLVRIPAIYELAPGQLGMSVGALISMAGGFTVRGRYDLALINLDPDGRTRLSKLSDDRGLVRDSDVLIVRPTAEQTVGSATLQAGATNSFSGTFAAQTTQLSDMLKIPGVLGEDPYPLFAMISRRDPTTLLRTLIAVTPSAVMAGREDFALQSDDIVHVFNRTEAINLINALTWFDQRQRVQSDRIQNSEATSLLGQPDNLEPRQATQNSAGDNGRSAAAVAGQDVNSALSDNARQVRDVNADNDSFNSYDDNYDDSSGGGNGNNGAGANNSYGNANSNNDMSAGDNGASPNANNTDAQAFGHSTPNASGLNGVDSATEANTNNSGGTATGVNTPRNVQQLVRQDPYARYRRELARVRRLAEALKVEPLIAATFLQDHMVVLSGAIRGPGSYLVGPDLPLSTLVQAAGGTVGWSDKTGVERISTLVDSATGQARTAVETLNINQDQFASAIVRPRDQFRFPEASVAVLGGTVTLKGEVRHPGVYNIVRGEHLSNLLVRAGGLTQVAYPYGTVFLRKSVAAREREGFDRAANDLESQLSVSMTRPAVANTQPNIALNYQAIRSLVNDLRHQPALGRVSVVADPAVLATHPEVDPLLETGDLLYIPPRPSTVTVLGEVMHSASFPAQPGMTVEDYINRAGGYGRYSDDSLTFVVLPDGTARQFKRSWFGLGGDTMPPGSTIVVPKDANPFEFRQFLLDASQIFGQFAISAASLDILSKQ